MKNQQNWEKSLLGDMMKKLGKIVLLIIIIQFINTLLVGQTTDLFFTEYIEGSSQNKALEIYNGTGEEVDLADYRIAQSVNGNGWQYWHTWTSPTIIEDGDVWVITTDEADAQIQSVADEILPYPAVIYFNGNDARGLEKTSDGGQSWILIDVIGVPTEDPGDGWSVAGTPNATKDHTLVRKSTITAGQTNWSASAGTDENDSEWIVYPQDTFDYIGSHDVNGDDTTPPTVTNVQAISLVTVEINFSEALNDTMAENETNYSISPSLGITSAERQNGNKVLLTTQDQTEGVIYSLNIINIEDLHENVIVETTVVFIGYQPGEYDLIADIQNNYENYEGQEVTVRGVVTIGDGLLKPNMTEFYVQDSSGKGIQIYNYTPLSTVYVRGDYVEVTGIVDKYEYDVEITNPSITLLYQSESLPAPHILVDDEDLTMNGTWTKVTGDITDVWDASEYGFYKITVSYVGGEVDLMFWNTAVPHESLYKYEEGDEISSYGIITFYEGAVQLTCAYENDISLYGGGGEYFEIEPSEPEPYDSVTVIFSCPDDYVNICDSVIVLWRTFQISPFNTITMNPIENSYNKFQAIIPGQPEATIVYYYVVIFDTSSGETMNFPENAPKNLVSFKYNVTSRKAILKLPPRTFCPILGEKLEIQVHSFEEDKVILRLYNSEGKLIYTFFNKITNGSESLEWDGKDETWNTLPPGLYICHLEVIDRNTGKTKTDTAPIVIAVPLKH